MKNKQISAAIIAFAVYTFIFNLAVLPVQAADWGNWNASQYNGIDFRVKCKDSGAGKYWWDIQFRNRYQKTAHFSYALRDTGQTPSHFSYRESVPSGSTQDGMGNQLSTSCNGTPIRVFIGEVRIGEDTGPYVTPN